jgi:hypothetical protein
LRHAEPPDLTGTGLTLLERAAEGEFGAWRAVDAAGRRFVVKTSWSEAGREAVERLAAIGYPAPRYVVARPGLCVQQELPGEPIGGWSVLDGSVALQLLELNEQLAGRRVADSPRWPERLLDDMHSYNGWVDPADLERHSDDGAELLRRCRAAVERADLQDTGDLVHWDYTTSNVLVADGRVTGIVDWDGALNGDRIFDVATLFYYTRTPLLRDYALEQRDERVFAAYLAHMILRQTGWSIRYHEPDAGTQLIRDGLELSKTFPG